MISFDEASAKLARVARPLGRESVALEDAASRTVARDIVARIDSPRRAVSAMDGYAVRDADLATFPVQLTVVGQSLPGQGDLPSVGPGQCVRIFTGAAVPDAADRVVIQEIVERDGDRAFFKEQCGSARHIRPHGSDFLVGDTIVPSGTLLNARAIVAAAAADVARIEVFRRPRFIVLSTGDELAPPGTAHTHPAHIPDSLSLGICALGEQWGGVCVGREREIDYPSRLQRVAGRCLDLADVLVVTGGASVGEKDFAKAMFGDDGLELIFSKVAIKPGKPVWVGRSRGCIVLGLPGNPTSAMVTARLFLAPLIVGLSGRDPSGARRSHTAALGSGLGANGNRETFLRGRWRGQVVEPLPDQDSGAQKALVEADLLIRRPVNAAPAAAGEGVELLDF